jgi:ribosomal protein S18 acetylase RimI-like enzyme
LFNYFRQNKYDFIQIKIAAMFPVIFIKGLITMDKFIIRQFQQKDKDAVIQLWYDCDLVVPWNDPANDIDIKMNYQPDFFLVGELNRTVIATIMIGYEGHRGWINYLAVSPVFQKHGYGRLLMQRAEELLTNIGCPKINLQVRETNQQVIDFYFKLGFKDDHVKSLGKRLKK